MPKPMNADLLLRSAKKAVKDQDWVTAIDAVQQMRQRFPANKKAKALWEDLRTSGLPALVGQAQSLLAAGDKVAAAKQLRAAHALSPSDLGIGSAYGICLLDMGRAPSAEKVAAALLPHHPGNLSVLNLQGRALREMGRSEAARACFDKALATAPDDPQTLSNIGTLERALGRREAAVDAYRKALKAAPDNVTLHHNMAQAVKYTASDAHLRDMKELNARLGAGKPDHAPLSFALFKALDEIDARAEAFGHLEKGNKRAASLAGFDFQSHKIPYALSKVLFENAQIAPASEVGALAPIFVTGLPRSGTSLVERILARHHGAQPCGELTVVPQAVSALLTRIMARDAKVLQAQDIADLRSEMLEGFAAYSDGRPILIDKMPLNYRWIGYICAALPEAKVVHIVRDPMPVAWSLYKLKFQGEGNDFVYDPTAIAQVMYLHDTYMTLWRAQCGDRIVELRYEELIANTELETQKLATALGLDWSEDWLSPERAESQVLTASADQVRRPIYRDANADWRRYEAQLAPLQNALEKMGLL